MKADFTKDTFDPNAQRRTVRFQQGRPPLDAEVNESQDILANRIEVEATDIIGPAGAPVANAGFELMIDPSGDIVVGAGRYYVDGILCELAEPITLPADAILMPEPLPDQDGIYLAYLDVWIDHLTALEDASMQEVALHGAETTTREVVRGQIRFAEAALEVGPEEIDCMEDIYKYEALTTPPTGTLAARAEPEAIPADDCSMTPGAGYRRLENQLYRVEIHSPGNHTTATYKWSRENGSILAPWLGINGSEITIGEQGRDPNRAFRPGNWIELIDRERELRGVPGTLVQIVNVNENTLTIDPATATDTITFGDFNTTPRVRRWESAGALPINHDPNAEGYSNLEYGVQIQFGNGSYLTGDYWLIPARTATGDIEWPRDATTDEPEFELRKGVWHHYAKLAILELSGETWSLLRDCRKKFPPLGSYRTCCSLFVGDGKISHGDFNTFEKALQNLPITGGSICFLPGEHRVEGIIRNRKNIKISGCGKTSRILPSVNSLSPAVFTVLEGSNVYFEKLDIENPHGIGIYFGSGGGTGDEEFRERGKRKGIEKCAVLNCQIKTQFSAIVAERWQNLEISGNEIFQPHTKFGGPALILQATYVAILKNTIIHAREDKESLEEITWGGIQILGGSAEWLIKANTIEGAGGNGITIGGSLQDYDDVINQVGERRMLFTEVLAMIREKGDAKSIPIEWLRDLTSPQRSRNLPISRIRIIGNNISSCGLSAIGVIPPPSLEEASHDSFNNEFSLNTFGGDALSMVFDALFPTEPVFFRERLIESLIQGNRIERMFRLDAPALAGTQVYGFGGITLGATRLVTIRQNEITDFGDPTEKAAAAIFVLAAEGLNIEGNSIRSLPARDPIKKLPQGFRGGIIVRLAMKAPAQAVKWAGNRSSLSHTPHSLEVVNNSVESARGRALTLLGFGDMRVEDNRLQSGAPGPSIMDRVIGNSLILNLGGLLETLRLFFIGKGGPAGIGGAQVAIGSYFNTTTYAEDEEAADAEAEKSLKMGEFDPKTKVQSEAYALFGARTHVSRNRFILTEENISAIGQLTAGLGDVAFIDNQSTSFQLHTLPIHSIQIGAQVRVAHNRISEAHLGTSGSLITLAFGHNSTVDNQTDHCVFAKSGGLAGGTLVDHDNQILYATQCAQMGRTDGQSYLSMIIYSLIAANAGSDVSEKAKEDLAEETEPTMSELFDTNKKDLINKISKSLEDSMIAIEIADNHAAENINSNQEKYFSQAHPLIVKSETYSARARLIRNQLDSANRTMQSGVDLAPKKGEARVEGKLSAKDQDTIKGAKVELVSRQSGKLFAQSEVNETGSFKIELNAEKIRDIDKRHASELRMVVRAKDGTIIKEMDAPFTSIGPNTVARGSIDLTPRGFNPETPLRNATKATDLKTPAKKVVKPTPAKKKAPMEPVKKTVRPNPAKNVVTPKPTKKVVKPTKKTVKNAATELQVLRGLNPARVKILENEGVKSVEEIAKIDPKKLIAIIGEARAKKLILDAKKVLKEKRI